MRDGIVSLAHKNRLNHLIHILNPGISIRVCTRDDIHMEEILFMKWTGIKSWVFGLLFFSIGCGHAPAPYMPSQIEFVTVSPQTLADRPDQATLHVLIIYGPASCNHVALRLFSPDKGAVFWDPAGYYGIQGSITAHRKNDILIRDAPSLETYISFRTETEFPSKAMEIFEWQISKKQALRLQQTLIQGAKTALPQPGTFKTKGTGLYCGSDVSGFLDTYAADVMTIEQTFYPHDMEKQLYTQKPDRIFFIEITPRVSIREIKFR